MPNTRGAKKQHSRWVMITGVSVERYTYVQNNTSQVNKILVHYIYSPDVAQWGHAYVGRMLVLLHSIFNDIWKVVISQRPREDDESVLVTGYTTGLEKRDQHLKGWPCTCFMCSTQPFAENKIRECVPYRVQRGTAFETVENLKKKKSYSTPETEYFCVRINST